MTVCYATSQFSRSGHGAAHGAPEVTTDLLVEALDLIDLAIMLLERGGRVVYANRAARDLLVDGDIVRLGGGRIATPSVRSSAGLQGALAALARGGGSLSRHGIAVPLADGEGDVRAASWVLPLSRARMGGLAGSEGAVAMMIVRPVARAPEMSAEFLARCHGITQAERRLLETLVDGTTVADAARTLKISLNTAKSHLKSLFAKTGTNRQAELMRLALNTAPPASI